MSDPSDRSPTFDRRTLLHAIGGGSLAALAGCGGDGTGATTTAGTTAPTATRSPTATPGATSTAPSTSEPEETTTTPSTPSIDDLRNDAIATVHDLDQERYDAVYDRVTDEVANQVTAAELGTIWERRASEKGRLQSVRVQQQGTSGGYEVFVLRATFESGTLRIVLSFSEGGKIAGIQFPPSEESYSPPEYADTSAFSETTLTLDTACGLGATLSMPNGDGTVPGVVLVHGSGPNDRDGTIGPNKPYRDLAWGIASRGVAVLRYDKRSYACDVSGPATLDELVVNDALAALDRLEGHGGIGPRVVVGHSLGAMAAPRIAARAGDLAGTVMLAANARPLHEMIVAQTEYLVELDGTVTEAEQQVLDERRAAADRIESGPVPGDETVLGASGAFWNSLAEYDQVETAESLPIPLYFLQGGRDYQVTPEGNFERWKAALGDEGTVSFTLYEDLNHLFMPGSGPPDPDEYTQPGNVAKRVVEDLAEWIDARS
ncbi:MAG: pimeloyl-ACP methyl ester carboxylesterase [Halobacteriales archaeon]|jgi:pimeloyl-ACP methyl ester carboxylesterase